MKLMCVFGGDYDIMKLMQSTARLFMQFPIKFGKWLSPGEPI